MTSVMQWMESITLLLEDAGFKTGKVALRILKQPAKDIANTYCMDLYFRFMRSF